MSPDLVLLENLLPPRKFWGLRAGLGNTALPTGNLFQPQGWQRGGAGNVLVSACPHDKDGFVDVLSFCLQRPQMLLRVLQISDQTFSSVQPVSHDSKVIT